MRQSRWWSTAWLGLGVILGLGLAACGDTWQGVKKDTGQNMEAVGETIDKSGEKVEESAE
jgi:predicted small secreted protein